MNAKIVSFSIINRYIVWVRISMNFNRPDGYEENARLSSHWLVRAASSNPAKFLDPKYLAKWVETWIKAHSWDGTFRLTQRQWLRPPSVGSSLHDEWKSVRGHVWCRCTDFRCWCRIRWTTEAKQSKILCPFVDFWLMQWAISDCLGRISRWLNWSWSRANTSASIWSKLRRRWCEHIHVHDHRAHIWPTYTTAKSFTDMHENK
jgi:hypothetical protein